MWALLYVEAYVPPKIIMLYRIPDCIGMRNPNMSFRIPEGVRNLFATQGHSEGVIALKNDKEIT